MTAKTVLISGAGIGGPTLTFWLKAAGFEPTLIEHAATLRTGGYVVDFWGLGYDIAERMGLAGQIDRVGYHIREMRIVDDHGERVTGFGTKILQELTGGRFVTLGRSDMSRLLFEKIKGTTEVIFDEEIIGLQACADHMQVQFRHAGERRFDLVIGADGLHSNVRGLVFGPQDRFEKQLGYVVAAFEARGYRPRDEDVYLIYGEPGRMLGRFALHDDRTLFLFVFTADVDTAGAMLHLPAQKAMLRGKFGDGKWECQHILETLDRTQDLDSDRVQPDQNEKSLSKGCVASLGMPCSVCPSVGKVQALAMTAADALAGESAKAGGLHEAAFGNYEILFASLYRIENKRSRHASPGAFAPST